MRRYQQLFTATHWRSLVQSVIVLLMLNISMGHCHAQADSVPLLGQPDMSMDSLPQVKKVDIVDILKLMLGLNKNPFRINKHPERADKGPFYTIVAFPGYAIATGVAGVVAFNIAFRPQKSTGSTLSFFNNNFQYTQYNQILIQSLSNIYTRDNKWQFPGDIRYFNFPTSTYGLGTSSLPASEDDITYSHFRFYRTVYRQVYASTFVGIGYNIDYRWHIIDYDALQGVSTDFVRYGYKKHTTSSGLSLNFLYDTKDNDNRPIYGTYVNFQFTPYLKALGSTNNWSSLIIDIRKYFPLTKKWYAEIAVWGYAWLTLNGRPPYLDMPSTGWDSYNNTGRGYAAGRFRGRDMLYFETEFRFDILRNGLLGGVVFGNLQSFTEFSGKFFGPVQPGGGAGLRIKFNKHTNSNSCLDYGFGTHSSRGFATNINEVF